MADVQFVALAHATVDLNSLLGDEFCGVADLCFGNGSQFRFMRFLCHKAEGQMLCERDRFFERDEHVNHAVLQHLKRFERYAELLPAVLER